MSMFILPAASLLSPCAGLSRLYLRGILWLALQGTLLFFLQTLVVFPVRFAVIVSQHFLLYFLLSAFIFVQRGWNHSYWANLHLFQQREAVPCLCSVPLSMQSLKILHPYIANEEVTLSLNFPRSSNWKCSPKVIVLGATYVVLGSLLGYLAKVKSNSVFSRFL